jgi:DNA-binding transcriptional MerR regulator
MIEQRKSKFSIDEYLRQLDTREKIQRKMIEAGSAATVTVTRAADLFGFSGTQLRDWDKLGFVSPPRSEGATQEDKKHRQYSRAELDVLATIRILRDNGYSINEIKQHIDVVREIASQLGQEIFTLPGTVVGTTQSKERAEEDITIPPIDQMLDKADDELFWRFFATNALRLSLSLLAEYNPNTMIGIVMPLHSITPPAVTTANIAELGECLIGWLRPDYSFYLLYTPCPSFEVPTDFRMHPLQTVEDRIWTVVQRKPGQINVNSQVRSIIQRLLAPLYEYKREWLPFFKAGQSSFSFPIADFVPEAAENTTKRIHLTCLANLVVSMGREKGWSFACILTPSNPNLSISEHQLIVEAVSEHAPEAYKEKLEKTIIYPTAPVISVSMRAYQGGCICYRHRAAPQDESIFNYDLERPLGSCIAVPIGGEEAKPLGAIYFASSQQDAFDLDDQRLLRIIARMIQELLLNFQARFKVTEQLKSLVEKPALADLAFDIKGVFSETELIDRLEQLLQAVWLRDDLREQLTEILELDDIRERRAAMHKYFNTNDVLTFYSFDVNDQTSLTQKYGEVMTRNLSRAVVMRARNMLKTLFISSDLQLYHAYGDRFYVFLGGIPLDEAKLKVWALKKRLEDEYKIDALRFSTESPTPVEMRVQVEITVRFGIICYPAIKAYELMQRLVNKLDPTDLQAAVASQIRNEFDNVLKLGLGVRNWDPDEWRWTEL